MNDNYISSLEGNNAPESEQHSDSYYQELLNSFPGYAFVAVLAEDGKMHTHYVTPSLVEMLGYPDYESGLNAIRSNPTEGVDENDLKELEKQVEGSISCGKKIKSAFRCRSHDGKELWLLLVGSTDTDKNGKTRLFTYITDITKEKEYEVELNKVAYTDHLTGSHNRASFIKAAAEMISANPLTEYTIMRLNVEKFKLINDLHGRSTGDRLLKLISETLKNEIGDKGIFARLYADHFALLVPFSDRSLSPAMIIGMVESAVLKSGIITGEINFYIGAYKITDHSLSIENMLDRASTACREITGNFHEHTAYYDEKIRLRMLEEQSFCDECFRAVNNNEFRVFYQAIYGVKAKKFVSAEALVRWAHPTKGLFSPGKFIPVFEKNGFISVLDQYVIEQVCKFQQKCRKAGLEPFPISVNISRTSLYNPDLFDRINGIAKKYKVDPSLLRIEITESAYSNNSALLLDTTKKLRSNGYPVLMDDFGTGYSSLNTLKDIPFDILKLDMKFMEDFEENKKVGPIVTSIARMAKWLNVPLLAEGVETRKQFEFLQSIGCSYIQGFYFAKPCPEQEFLNIISQNDIPEGNSPVEEFKFGDEIVELFGNDSIVSKLIDSIHGGFGIYELSENKLEVIRVNEEYMNMMGYSSEDGFPAENANAWDSLQPDDVEISRKACLETAKTGRPVRAVCRRYTKNGDVIWLEAIHRRLGGTDLNPIISISLNNVTEKAIQAERSKAEEESELEAKKREREFTDNLLRKTVRHIPAGLGIFRLTDDGIVPVYLSERMYKLLGTSDTNYVIGMIPGVKYINKQKVTAKTNGEFVFPYARPDGNSCWLKINYHTTEENGNIVCYTVLSDISDQRETKRQETVRERMYQVLIEESNTIIFSYSPDIDELTYYRNTEFGESISFTVRKLTSNLSELSFIFEGDRELFVNALKKLTDCESTESVFVRVLTEGYPRRHKATLKSISDNDGVVFRIIGKLEDVDDEMSRIEEIQSRAMYDSLCVDVYNKATTEELIRNELERSVSGALIMIDIDDFKSINDRLGHIFGDEFLKIFATTLKNVFRESDIVGRYGGDEYFVFVPHATASLAERKGKQILQKVSEINIPELGTIKGSVGISIANPDNRVYRQLLKQADSALYQAKNRGKNCVVLFDPHSMNEGSFRTEEAMKQDVNSVVLSSNPSGATSLVMRIFSLLYSSTDIISGINRSIEYVGKSFDVSRVYIFEDSEDGEYCSNTFEWCADGITPEIDSLQNLSYEDDLDDSYRDNMNDDGIFYCRDVKELTGKDSTKAILERQGIKSVLQCAILDNGEFKGFVGFDECRENRFWTQEQIDSLVFLSKVLSVFLIKSRNSIRSNSNTQTMKNIVDNYPT